MKRNRRILAVLEGRATYGYSKNVMLAMQRIPSLELCTLVTGAHLVPELGNSYEQIKKDGFPISATVSNYSGNTSRSSWSSALGRAIEGYANAYEQLKPDILLLFGDRIETFGCCVAAAYMKLPIAHVQAGDKSGHIDDSARMAIAKLAHIHLASCDDSSERLIRLGEQPFRIHNVGAPQLDDIIGVNYAHESFEHAGKHYDLRQPYILLVQHPVLVEMEDAYDQMRSSIEACLDTGLKVFCIYPNSDLGFRKTLEAVEEKEHSENLIVLDNVERQNYLTLMAGCSVLVGNSSSGILEAPSFKVPVINIGNRQRGRPQASNILNCGYKFDDINDALETSLNDSNHKQKCAAAVNLYGDGNSSDRICQILQNVKLDQQLIDKETVY